MTTTSIKRFTSEVASAHAERLEHMATAANSIFAETQDERWHQWSLTVLAAIGVLHKLMNQP